MVELVFKLQAITLRVEVIHVHGNTLPQDYLPGKPQLPWSYIHSATIWYLRNGSILLCDMGVVADKFGFR